MMQQKISIAVLSLLAAASHVALADDGVELATAAEELDMLVPGPNVGQTALPTPDSEGTTRRVHATVGFDLTGAYFSRGLRQEDRGILFQPYATFGFDVVQSEAWNLQLYAGTWNSVHDRKTAAGTSDNTLAKWYEADAYFGANAEFGKWSAGIQYGWFLSPSDAFTTVEELQLSAAYDDSEAMGAWSLSPAAALVIETGDGTSDGLDKGAYLQLSVEPGFDIEQETVESLRLSFPVVLGVSAWDYYQDADGDNVYGCTSVGAKLSCELHSSEEWGTVGAYAALNFLHLGTLGKSVNDDEDTALVWSCGLSYEF